MFISTLHHSYIIVLCIEQNMSYNDARISPDKRELMFNHDKSSCFMHSLLVALFFPSRMCMLDPFFLDAKRVPTNRNDETSAKLLQLSDCLAFISSVVRGNIVSHPNIRYTRQTIGRLVTEIKALKEMGSRSEGKITTPVDFASSQQDPTDLLENLLEFFQVNGVFQTMETIRRVYTNGKVTNNTVVHLMYRQSVVALVATNKLVDLNNLFPYRDELLINDDATGTYGEEDVLKSKTTTVYYAGGPALFITREMVNMEKNPIKYGTYNHRDKSYKLKFTDILTSNTVTFQLQSILCFCGSISKQVTDGHYVCYVYEENSRSWWFYNDLSKSKRSVVSLLPVPESETLETYPVGKTKDGRLVNPFMPSTNGTLFMYAQM
jgi:hypothetical protein